MNRFLVFCILFAVLSLSQVMAQSTAAAEVTFVFTRQSGAGSNQFAVWIEDTQGRHIKTLYATNFTANGGWKRRPTSIPVWVQRSDIAGMSKAQIDSLTGATPRTGTLNYRWDGTDSRNTAVQPGDYVIFLEATLRMEKQVLYRAPIRLGQGASTPVVTIEYTGDPGAEQGMINNVVVRTLR